jgi:hypothetical protein
MSLPGPGQGGSPGPGAILALALESLRGLRRNRGSFVRLAILPALASFLLEVVLFNTRAATLLDPRAPRQPEAGDLVILFGVLLINFLPVTLFAVAWTRVLLLGPATEPGLLHRWGARELGYLGRLLPLVLVTAGIVILPTGLFGTGTAIDGVLTVVSVVLALGLFARAMLVLPAAALDLPFGLVDSLRATRGAVPLWTLIALVLVYLPFLPVYLLVAGLLNVTGLALAAPYASLFLQVAIGYAMQASAVGLQALLLRQLTGWRPNLPTVVSA